MARNARLLAAASAAVALCLATSAAAATSPYGPLIERWNGTELTPTAAPGQGSYSAAAALSSTDVWAVGTHLVGDCDEPISARWDGMSWQGVPMPAPQGCSNAGFSLGPHLSASSPTAVWAVGGKMVERWDGTAWRIVRAPRHGVLAGVAALSPGDVWVVGTRRISFLPRGKTCCTITRSKTFVAHWNGSAWRRLPSPNPSHSNPAGARRSDELNAVAAASRRSVWAVGDYFRNRAGGHAYQTLVLHWDGRRWKRVPSPNPGGMHATALYAVAAVGAKDAWAVGTYRNGHGVGLPLVEHWDGHRWRVVPAPPGDAGAPEQALTALGSLGPDDVWAAGWYLDSQNLVGRTLVEHWNGSSWSIVPSQDPDTEDTFSGIAAAAPDDVWAVGGYANP